MSIMDISKLTPNALITDEMLDLIEKTFILVITNHEREFEAIRYMGHSEIEAYQKYKAISHNDKIIVNAAVTYSNFFKEKYGTEFIIEYRIIDVIKKGI